MLFNSQEEVKMVKKLIVGSMFLFVSTVACAGLPLFGVEDDGYGSFGRFEEHGLNDFSKPYRVGVVNKRNGHPVRAGRQSIRFEVRAGDCGSESGFSDCSTPSERSELHARGKDRAGKNYWYAWSMYLKNYKDINGIGVHFGQWKQLMTKPWKNHYTGKWETQSHDVVQFTTWGHRGLVLEASKDMANYKTYTVIPAKEMSNKWHDLVLNIKWSPGADGLIQVYKNGKLIVNHKGPNVTSMDPLTFRFGAYRPMVDRYGKPLPTQVIYYDEVMRGNTCQSVSMFQNCRFAPKPTVNHHNASLNPKKPTVKINDYAHSRGDRFWGLNKGSILGQEILEMAGAIPNNPNMFSFDRYQYTALNKYSDSSYLVGIQPTKAENDYEVEGPIAFGYKSNNSTFIMAMDKSFFGYRPKGYLNIGDPLTTYLNYGYTKKVNEQVMFNLNTTMAYAQGDPAGIISNVEDSLALGFSVGAQYKVVEDHQLSLNIRQPLRVESSKLETTNFIADLAPSGRQVNYVFGYNYQMTEKSGLVTELSYVDDIDHVHSTSDYRAMIKYRITL